MSQTNLWICCCCGDSTSSFEVIIQFTLGILYKELNGSMWSYIVIKLATSKLIYLFAISRRYYWISLERLPTPQNILSKVHYIRVHFFFASFSRFSFRIASGYGGFSRTIVYGSYCVLRINDIKASEGREEVADKKIYTWNSYSAVSSWDIVTGESVLTGLSCQREIGLGLIFVVFNVALMNGDGV